MITATEMQKRSLKARYKKYGGKEGFRKFMREVASKGGKITQAKKRAVLTK